jgi:hypothetical protein
MDFTIIGVLGPAGSGKDLVADWFVSKGFVKVAFSDPMKRFSQKAFSLSTEQLWGPSHERNKRFPIDSSWWFNALGNLQDASKEIVQVVLQKGDKINGYLKLLDWFTWLRKTYPKEISAREILQTVGTEWGRTVDSFIWCRQAYLVAEKVKSGLFNYSQEKGLSPINLAEFPYGDDSRKGIIITDHRFINEVNETKKHGYVLRLRRLAREQKVVGIDNHPSESEQTGIPDSAFDLVLEFPEGVERVHAMLEEAMKEQAWTQARSS